MWHLCILVTIFSLLLSSDHGDCKERMHRRHKSTEAKHAAQYHHARHGEFKWLDVKDIPGVNDQVQMDPDFRPLGTPVERILGDQPLYVSMTTIKARLPFVIPSIQNLLNSTVLPTQIFVVISQGSYLYDEGVKPIDIPYELLRLQGTGLVSIIYSENIGPHRKLLPVLSRFWNQDCVIVTMDDDREPEFLHTALARLLDYYIASGRESIVGLRVRRLGFCEPKAWKLIEYSVCNWPQIDSGRTEMLVLPTGSGSILYRPKFFTDLVFDRELRELTATNDDLAFRLVTMMNNVPVVMGCCDEKHPCWIPETSLVDATHTAYPTPAPIGLSESQKIRLWSANREKNRNGRMWMNSVIYLEDKKGFNFAGVLKKYLQRERGYCMSADNKEPQYECAISEVCPVS